MWLYYHFNMKAFFRLSLTVISIIIILALASCAKQEQTEQAAGNEKIFTAVIEQGFTKTTITEANKIYWQRNDEVIINGAEYYAIPKNPASRAVFQHMSGPVPATGPYTAIYPASLYNPETSGYELPAVTTYQEDRSDTPMFAESDTEELSFKNICGVLHLVLTGADKVRTIRVSAQENICGPFEINDEGAAVPMGGGNNEFNTFTIDCGTDGIQLSSTPKDFFIPIPAQEYAAGLTISVTSPNPLKHPFVKTTNPNLPIDRNTLYTLTWEVQMEISPEVKMLFGKTDKKWIWQSSSDAYTCWGNGGNAGNGSAFTANTVDGHWWGVNTPEELMGQLNHAKGHEAIGVAAASPDAYMIFDSEGQITSYAADGTQIAKSTYSIINYDPTRESNSGWELGKLVTAEPAVLFPFSINEEGKMVTEFDIMYLDPNYMTLVYTKGNGAGSWGEITHWMFKSAEDFESALTGNGTRRWSWPNDGYYCWGNAGNSGQGALFGPTVVDGIWWGVSDASELMDQLAHAGGTATGAEDNDAYMVFTTDGKISSYTADGSLIATSTYEIKDWDPTRVSSGGWELGKLVTAQPAVLFPFSINEGGVSVTEFDIMYLDGDNITLVYTKGNGAGNWGEITYWRFKPKN